MNAAQYLSNLFEQETNHPYHQNQLEAVPQRIVYQNEVIITEKAQEDEVWDLR